MPFSSNVIHILFAKNKPRPEMKSGEKQKLKGSFQCKNYCASEST